MGHVRQVLHRRDDVQDPKGHGHVRRIFVRCDAQLPRSLKGQPAVHRVDARRQGGDHHGLLGHVQGGRLLHPARLRPHCRHGVGQQRGALHRACERVRGARLGASSHATAQERGGAGGGS